MADGLRPALSRFYAPIHTTTARFLAGFPIVLCRRVAAPLSSHNLAGVHFPVIIRQRLVRLAPHTARHRHGLESWDNIAMLFEWFSLMLASIAMCRFYFVPSIRHFSSRGRACVVLRKRMAFGEAAIIGWKLRAMLAKPGCDYPERLRMICPDTTKLPNEVFCAWSQR